MPIYEYRCASCGCEKEYLQKLSDPPMKTCPSCGADALTKLISAAGFHLKGSGWYATDFKKSPASSAAKSGDKPAAESATDKKPAEGGETKASDKPAESGESKASDKKSAEGGESKASAGSHACGGGCSCS
jgi:putative FmdB family regulatory protein